MLGHLLLAALIQVPAPTQDLAPGTRYDSSIPTLKDVVGHDFREEITHPDEIVTYFQALAEAGRWLTNDGSFTISIWSTKTSCASPGWYESVVGYYKYPDRSLWDPENTHISMQMGCASFAHSTIEGATQ